MRAFTGGPPMPWGKLDGGEAPPMQIKNCSLSNPSETGQVRSDLLNCKPWEIVSNKENDLG